MYTIENEHLKIMIKPKGAELTSIYNKNTSLEYLWDGNPNYWNKQSPILFPIVGTLKKDTYFYKGQSYTLPRHGFARDRSFTCSAQEKTSVIMSLLSDEETLAVYPFHFRLDIIYSLDGPSLNVKYKVTNTVDDDLYFSIGGHPAFKLPLEDRLDYNDYCLEFEKTEHALRWPISRDGLIEAMPTPFLSNTSELRLHKQLFSKDALVFKYLNSNWIKIRTRKSEHGITFHFPRFPFLGIWAAPNADFVCIEPWCGIADSTTSNQQIESKEGIILLTGGSTFERSWWISVT